MDYLPIAISQTHIVFENLVGNIDNIYCLITHS